MRHAERITCAAQSVIDLKVDTEIPDVRFRGNPRIGFLDSTFLDRLSAFRQGLKETGHVEGENVTTEYRWANNQRDRLPELAAELVRRRVALIAARTVTIRRPRPQPRSSPSSLSSVKIRSGLVLS
jgi:hypothetical protein